jgi:hypothetical protein
MGIRIALACLAAIFVLSFSGPAPAITTGYNFQTPLGATVGGQPVNASATVQLSPENDRITVHLYNNQANPTSVIQDLSDFGFSLSTGQVAGSMGSSLGPLIKIDANGGYSFVDYTATGWELQSNYNFVPMEN